ncbi:patatin-like phospholipase family protein [Klebsiella sp. B345]|uniref:patatin-like phospholipase family protein n=1 Tax=Klebsiella sp. B345 TaxID=2755398 RepID=UPI003DA8DDFD
MATRKILSIDGGGIRGIIPALILAEIEGRVGKPISKCFDLMAGTSTGALLALGCAKKDSNGNAKYKASDLVKIYEDRGKDIFPRSFWKGVSSVAGLADETYPAKGLESVLNEYFGDDEIKSSLTKTLVTSYDIQQRTPLFLKSWDDKYSNVLMKDAARATSAAPTYFEPAYISVGGSKRALIDGGVFINSPAVSAFVEAKKIFPDDNDFILISLGTGEHTRAIPYDEAKEWGKLEWVLPLLSCMFDGSADAVNYQMNSLLGEKYYRFQATLDKASDDMDNVTKANIEALKMAANFIISNQSNEIGRVCELLK